jgi:hypothetical protein
MVKRELITAGDFESIARLAAEAVALVRSCRPDLATASTPGQAG